MRLRTTISALRPSLVPWILALAAGLVACGDVSTASRVADADPAGRNDGGEDGGPPATDGPRPPDVGPAPDGSMGAPSDVGPPPMPDALLPPSPDVGPSPAPEAGFPPDIGLPPDDARRPPAADATLDAARPDAAPLADAHPFPGPDVAPPSPDGAVDAAIDAMGRPDAGPTVDGPVDASPMADAIVDASPNADASLPTADAAVDASPDVAVDPEPDVGAPVPDAGPQCAVDERNACGACGPLPEEVCNGADDDCDGETDEGDVDADGLDDCRERISGLDPTVADDPAADPDHDEVSNADEVAAGTHAAPVLRLEYAPTEDPALFEVRVLIAPATDELRPILAEIFVRFTGRVVPEDCVIGDAAVLADKDLFWHPFGDDQVRFTLLAANLQRMGDGELARIRFRRTGAGALRFTFIPHAEQLAPIETQDAATYGVGHPDEPLVVAGVPLLIDEVDYDQISTDTTEFVELVNPNGFPVELDGLALEVRNGLTGALLSSTGLADAGPVLPAGGRLVYGMPRVLAALPADVLRLPQGPNLPNAAGSVRIVDLRPAPPEVLDALGWEAARADLALCEGRPVGEDPNDRPALGFSRCPDANDSDDNAADFALTAPTPGGPNVCP